MSVEQPSQSHEQEYFKQLEQYRKFAWLHGQFYPSLLSTLVDPHLSLPARYSQQLHLLSTLRPLIPTRIHMEYQKNYYSISQALSNNHKRFLETSLKQWVVAIERTLQSLCTHFHRSFHRFSTLKDRLYTIAAHRLTELSPGVPLVIIPPDLCAAVMGTTRCLALGCAPFTDAHGPRYADVPPFIMVMSEKDSPATFSTTERNTLIHEAHHLVTHLRYARREIPHPLENLTASSAFFTFATQELTAYLLSDASLWKFGERSYQQYHATPPSLPLQEFLNRTTHTWHFVATCLALGEHFLVPKESFLLPSMTSRTLTALERRCVRLLPLEGDPLATIEVFFRVHGAFYPLATPQLQRIVRIASLTLPWSETVETLLADLLQQLAYKRISWKLHQLSHTAPHLRTYMPATPPPYEEVLTSFISIWDLPIEVQRQRAQGVLARLPSPLPPPR